MPSGGIPRTDHGPRGPRARYRRRRRRGNVPSPCAPCCRLAVSHADRYSRDPDSRARPPLHRGTQYIEEHVTYTMRSRLRVTREAREGGEATKGSSGGGGSSAGREGGRASTKSKPHAPLATIARQGTHEPHRLAHSRIVPRAKSVTASAKRDPWTRTDSTSPGHSHHHHKLSAASSSSTPDKKSKMAQKKKKKRRGHKLARAPGS